MSQKEAQARIKINKLLEEAGWHLIGDGNQKANVQFETNIKIARQFGEDFVKLKNGFSDYLLLDERNFPICVLEAKNFFKSYLADSRFQEIIESKQFALLNANPERRSFPTPFA